MKETLAHLGRGEERKIRHLLYIVLSGKVTF